MRPIIITVILCILANYSFACIKTAKANVDTVDAIIVHKYNPKNKIFCENNSEIFIDYSSFFFLYKSSQNVQILQDYPYLKKIIGNINESDDLVDKFTKTYKYNLSYSDFNFIINSIVESDCFYYKENDTTLYIIYHFQGIVVRYSGIILSKYYKIDGKVLSSSWTDCDCIPYMSDNVTQFYILKEAFNLRKLTKEEEIKLNVKPSEKRLINILYCE